MDHDVMLGLYTALTPFTSVWSFLLATIVMSDHLKQSGGVHLIVDPWSPMAYGVVYTSNKIVMSDFLKTSGSAHLLLCQSGAARLSLSSPLSPNGLLPSVHLTTCHRPQGCAPRPLQSPRRAMPLRQSRMLSWPPFVTHARRLHFVHQLNPIACCVKS
jgi:hypothetical protein